MDGDLLNYEQLLSEAYNNDVVVKEIEFESDSKGLLKGKKVALSRKLITSKEKACVLAEELAHYKLTSGDIIDMKVISNRKQEHTARLSAYNTMIGLNGIINSFEARCKNRYDMAEYLEVTEDFLIEALKCYGSIYGQYAKCGDYVIYFDPLSILKKFRVNNEAI